MPVGGEEGGGVSALSPPFNDGPLEIKTCTVPERKTNNEIEKSERYAAREKFRRDTESYGNIFYNWEEILRDKEMRLEKEEQKRNERLKKAKKLKGIWDLMKICKEYLSEWGKDWRFGLEKNEERRVKGENLEREIRLEKVKEKKITFEKRKLQTALNFKIKNLGNGGKIEWEKEIRKERLELQELQENLWRWREGGGWWQERWKR